MGHFHCRYPINQQVGDHDRSVLMMALFFHPNRDEKIGPGAKEIKVTYKLGCLLKKLLTFK